ncbi:MAG: radical SAM protein [Myxococcota bacterium]
MSVTSFDLDCLLVHTPKADNHYLPIGDFFNITYLPMGMLALCEYIRRMGYGAEIIHLGVEWLHDPHFNLVHELEGKRIRAFGLSLYWHYQSYDVIEVARALKAQHPEAVVFLGGVTASYFARELLERFPFIDAIAQGHAETTLLALMEGLEAQQPLASIPGLVARAEGKVAPLSRHHMTFRHLPPTLDSLCFGDLSVLRHAEVYARSFGFPLAYSREFSAAENRNMLSMGRSFFPLFTGRGCPWQCSFCGGNRDTLRQINGTNKVQWRTPERVVEDIQRAMQWGYRTMSLCFDPTPSRPDYYLRLFQLIRANRLEVDFYFECWGLPTPEFVSSFKQTFPSPESYLALSPDAGAEAVRKANKQPYYSDAELFESMELLKAHEITVDIFFTLALPGERLPDAMTTALLKRQLATTYPNTRRVMTWTVQLEPGSPQFERPHTLGMQTDRSCFLDFYHAHGGSRADTYSSLGFKIEGYFGDERDNGSIADFERELQALKCQMFCFLAKDPRQWNTPEAGRRHCLERRTLLAERRGHAAPTLELGPGIYYEDALAEEQHLRGKRARHEWFPYLHP